MKKVACNMQVKTERLLKMRDLILSRISEMVNDPRGGLHTILMKNEPHSRKAKQKTVNE